MSKENIDNTTNSNVETNYFHVEDGVANTNASVKIVNGTTSTSTFMIHYQKKVENVEFIENEEGNFIEVTSVEESNFNGAINYTFCNSTPSKRMVKERYGVVNGKIQLIKAIKGIEKPGYYVPPTLEWEE